MLNFSREALDVFRSHKHSTILFTNDLKSKVYDIVCCRTLSFSKVLSLVSSSLHWSVNMTDSPSFLNIEFIKIQELSLLSEYFLVTALFCLTLFFLFSVRFTPGTDSFGVKFQYSNQLIFLLIYVLFCYLILVYQQMDI
jgi:ABC-type multidrug transport system permease subunit